MPQNIAQFPDLLRGESLDSLIKIWKLLDVSIQCLNCISDLFSSMVKQLFRELKKKPLIFNIKQGFLARDKFDNRGIDFRCWRKASSGDVLQNPTLCLIGDTDGET